MKSLDLEAEWDRAVGAVRQPHLDRMRAFGVSGASVATINLQHPAFGVLTGTGERGGGFVPGDGVQHVIQPAYEGGALIDLVAWRSADPARRWARTGLGWMLNADSCLGIRWDGDELTLHPTPLDWLQAGGTGGVVLDWESPDLRQLRCFRVIHCTHPALAVTLRSALTKMARVPIIRTAEVRHVA